MKIFYLTELLSPYRVEWMNLLSRDNDVTAYYLRAEEATRSEEWLTHIRPRFCTRQAETVDSGHRVASGTFLRGILREKYDIFVIDGYSSPVKLQVLFMLLKHHKKVFVNIDGIDIRRDRRRTDFIKDIVKKSVFTSRAYFLCGSHGAAEHIIKNGAQRSRVFVHPFTSLHAGDILPAGQKAELQSLYKKKVGLQEEKLVLAVGRFIPLKRYDCLIDAWRGMPENFRLFLIGGGTERINYEKQIADLGVGNIRLIDFITPDKLSDYYIAADLFVHPSETETWGLVINEAMAKGCPVITTDRCTAGVELIRDGKEGYLTRVGDANDLREKMLKLLNDDVLRESMAENAIQRIAPYTYEDLASVHMHIFKEITAAEG